MSPSIESEVEERDDVIITQMFWRSLSVFAVVLVICVVGGGLWVYSNQKRNRVDIQQESKPPSTRQVDVTIPDLPFANVTTTAGITFQHTNGATGQKLLPETMGSGCAFLDFDNDGDQDLLFVNSCSWPWDKVPEGPAPTMELYRNDGLGKFENVTADSGLGKTFYGMGVACGDYDADGWTDVFITAVGKNRLFRNDHGKFVETTDEATVGGDPQEWSTSAAFFDFDKDGDLDLFVGNYVRWSREIDMVQGFKLDGQTRAYGPPTAFDGTYPSLYRNEGNGKFKDVSAESGIQIKNPNRDVPVAKTMGVMPFDIDGDGWMDLIVSNDTVQNFAFVNQRDGKFQEVGIHCGVAFDSSGGARGAMGLDMAFFRNDDALGLAIGNFANEMTALYVSKFKSMLFTDEAIATGLGPPTRQELKFGIFFFDCDLDGRLDLLASNGHLEQEINKVQKSQHYEQPPHLLWNAGLDAKSEYVSVPAEKCGAEFMKPMVGRGSAYADIDGDGDLDVILTGNGGVPRLMRNDQKSGHHWLRLKLVGKSKQGNPEALGAIVKLKSGDIEQTRVVTATRSYCSSSELPVTFGLGKQTKVDSLHITWPSGDMQAVNVDKVDQLMKIEQE